MRMRFVFLLFFYAQFLFSQTAEIEKADAFSKSFNYTEEIDLRTTILEDITDKDSDIYKTQAYKLRLAEYRSSTDPVVRLAKIAEAERIYDSLSEQDSAIKIDLGIEHFEAFTVLGDFESAKNQITAVYEYAIQQSPSERLDGDLHYIYYELGKMQLYFNQFHNGIESLTSALEKAEKLYGHNSMQAANIYKELSIGYSYTSNYSEVIENQEKSIEIYETIQPKDPFILFNAYAGMYQTLKYYGDLDSMKPLYKKISDYYEANKHNNAFINRKDLDYPNLNSVNTIYYYVQLQNATTSENTEEAERVLKKFKNMLPKNKVKYTSMESNRIVSFYFETGSMFHNLEDFQNIENYPKARQYYSDVAEYSKENGTVFFELQAYQMLSTLGVDYHQWEEVVEYSNKALNHPNIEIFHQTQSLKHNLGLAYGSMKEYDKAFDIFDEQYEFYLENQENSYYSIQNLIESGDLYLELYKDNSQEDFLEKAYNNFHLASVIFSQLYRGGQFSTRLHNYANQINNGMLRASNQLGKYEKEVADRIEISNSDYLWSSFLSNRKVSINVEAQNLQTQLDSLKNQQHFLATQITLDTSGAEVSSLREELKSTEKVYQDKNQELKTIDHSFYQFSQTDFDLNEFQKKIKDNEYILKYIMTDASAFAYVIGRNSVDLVQLEDNGPVIKEKVTEFLQSLKTIDKEFTPQAQALYSRLIAPLEIQSDAQLVIVPDGFLANFPFETLIAPEGNFLIENHPVSYAYSIKLFDIQNTIEKSSDDKLVAFSPSYSLDFASASGKEDLEILVRSGNYELLGAQSESKTVSSLFKGDLFMGDKATKSNFIQNSPQYNVLHLAMHAIVDEDNPMQSNLIFQNDERLYMDELYQLKIPANLAVLSACNTGSGELKDGEGVLSLSRAFTYAGVKSTVMSLWPVPDKQTSMIMTDFYNYLKDGKPKNEALQLAKQNYLKTVSEAELKHPYYWAGFVISGDISPLETSKNYAWQIGLGMLVIIGSLLFFRSRKSKN